MDQLLGDYRASLRSIKVVKADKLPRAKAKS
jgi:hypothetical protein